MRFPSLQPLKPLLLATLTGALLATALPSQAQTLIVRGDPPPLRYEVVPVAPGPGYVWHHGHWYWNGYRYLWIPGRYVVIAGAPVVVYGGYGYGDHHWHHDDWRRHDDWHGDWHGHDGDHHGH